MPDPKLAPAEIGTGRDILEPTAVDSHTASSIDTSPILGGDGIHEEKHDSEAGQRSPGGGNRAPPQLAKWRLIALSISLCVGLFLSLLDTSIVATALFSIGTEFNALTSVNWVALAYTLAYLGCAVLFARISDIIGRFAAYVAAFVIFFAFSIGCGFSSNISQLIACRALQGIGGSGLYSLTMIIMSEIFPLNKSASIASLVGVVVAISGVSGPILGGVITHASTWRWIFWMNAPIGICAMILFGTAWPRGIQIQRSPRTSIRSLDVLGAVLQVAASVLVVFAFQEGGIGAVAGGHVWTNAIFLAPLIVGCICWILLFGWEAWLPKLSTVVPLLPMALLGRRALSFAILSTITSGFTYFVTIYITPIHVQVVYEKSALIGGLALLPMLGSAAVGSMAAGFFVRIKNGPFLILVVNSAMMAVGAGLLSTISSLQLQSRIFGFQVLVGFGFGMSVANVSILAARESQPRDRAVAQGIISQARILGGSIGIAASTAILGVIEQRELADIPRGVLTSMQSGAESLTPGQYLEIRQAYTQAYQETMRVAAIVSAVGVLLTFGTYKRGKRADSQPVQAS